jgi:hypothetical protein
MWLTAPQTFERKEEQLKFLNLRTTAEAVVHASSNHGNKSLSGGSSQLLMKIIRPLYRFAAADPLGSGLERS